MNNICKFIPARRSPDELKIINFIKETKYFNKEPRINATYMLCLVSRGCGVLHMNNSEYDLKPGSVFMTIPTKAFGIENIENLEYIYISFIGLRGVEFTERIMADMLPAVFYGFDDLILFWNDTLEAATNINIDLFAEGVLLYTLAKITKFQQKNDDNSKSNQTVDEIKIYVDNNFLSQDISLEKVAERFGYSKKYLSELFKKNFKIKFTEYIRQIRVQNACFLMEQGFTSVKEISYLSGFSDPLYFSRVFKGVTGKSPKEYISQKSF